MADASKLIDSFKDEDWLTIDDVATEVDLSVLRTRQVVTKALDEKLIQKLTKKDGVRVLYARMMIDQLKRVMDAGKLGRFNKKRKLASSTKHAQLVVTVPIFDEDIAKLLKTKFNDEDGINRFVKAKLEESVKPILAKKRELEERYEREMKALFQASDLSL